MKEELPVLHIVEHESVEPLQTEQSANSLFKFVNQADYLYSMLKNKAIVPRYYGENVEYLGIGHKTIWYPMACFCDINIHRIYKHADFYGKFGIAFSKKWGLSKGIQPVQYMNNESPLCKDLTSAFQYSLEAEDNIASDYLLSQMLYIKPVQGKMPRNDEEVEKNFTDECEWRFVPDVSSIDLPLAVTEDYAPCVDDLNKTLERTNACWLSFEYSEIKYIILPNEDWLDGLIMVVDEIGLEEREIRRLFSKILFINNAKEDF